jgi:spore coat polysaccharide biosynthesis protein SpsF
MAKRIVAIIQARMGSTRLPGKVLLPILDKTVIEHIVERLSSVKQIDQVVVATSIERPDDDIAKLCGSRSIHCYRGSESDVLDRFYKTAVSVKAEIVIRITGDCPLIDPGVISKLIEYFKLNEYDHCGVAAGAGVAKDKQINRFPDGLDAEIFSMKVLAEAWHESVESIQREHVTPFLWQQPTRYRIGSLDSESGDFGHQRWTLDNQEDFDLIAWIYEMLSPGKGSGFGMHDILSLLLEHPEKQKGNQHLIGEEGYEQFWDK